MKTLSRLSSGRLFRRRNDAGFTRRDLLAVVLVLGMLALLVAIMTPVWLRNMRQAHAQQLMRQGGEMYRAIFPKEADGAQGARLPAAKEEFHNSSQYFVHLVTNGTLKVDFSFFSGPGLARYHTGDPSAFRQDGNAWSVVEDTADAPAAAALFMSRNLLSDHRYLPTGRTVIPEKDMLEQGPGKKLTFNGRTVVVVTRAGAAWISLKRELPVQSLNPDDAERRILHP
jgi:hypothetical protein